MGVLSDLPEGSTDLVTALTGLEVNLYRDNSLVSLKYVDVGMARGGAQVQGGAPKDASFSGMRFDLQFRAC